MAVASTFTITTDDSKAPTQQTLQLRGRALPYRDEGGYTLEGKMRAEFTWYPGNAVATVQMLGGEEMPTTIVGMWKDRFIKSQTDEGVTVIPDGQALFNGQQVADVFALCAAVEKIRLAGQLIRVEWDSTVRVGILMRFKQQWLRREDVKWEMEFQWISRGEAQASVTLPSDPSPDSFAQQMRQLLGVLQGTLGAPDFPVVAEFTDPVVIAVNEIELAVAEIESAVANSVVQTLSPIEAAQRALAATRTIQEQTSAIVNQCDVFPPLSLFNVADRSTLGLQDALNAQVYARAIRSAAREIELSAADQADTLASQSRQQTLLASFVARAPQDLRKVALKYYGTADEWRRIMAFNDFASSTVPIGTLILVPQITFADARV